MYVCVYMCICVHVHIYIYIYTYIHNIAMCARSLRPHFLTLSNNCSLSSSSFITLRASPIGGIPKLTFQAGRRRQAGGRAGRPAGRLAVSQEGGPAGRHILTYSRVYLCIYTCTCAYAFKYVCAHAYLAFLSRSLTFG